MIFPNRDENKKCLKPPPRKHRGIVCLAILLVTFLGWWKRDPFKGCWWPPTRGSKGHFESPGVYYSILADVFWISHSCHLLGLVGSIWSPVEGYQITQADACFLASIPTHRREGKHTETWKDFLGTRTKHEKKHLPTSMQEKIQKKTKQKTPALLVAQLPSSDITNILVCVTSTFPKKKTTRFLGNQVTLTRPA